MLVDVVLVVLIEVLVVDTDVVVVAAPFWLIVIRTLLMRTLPCRKLEPGLAATVYDVEPLPVPLDGDGGLIQLVSVLAVQAHPLCVVIVTVPLPPLPGNVALSGGTKTYVQLLMDVLVVDVLAEGTLVVVMTIEVVVCGTDVVAGLVAAGRLIPAVSGLVPPQFSMLAPGVQFTASRVRGPE